MEGTENLLFLLLFNRKYLQKPRGRNWWDFLLETLHSIVNKFNVERRVLLAKQVPKLSFSVYIEKRLSIIHGPPSGHCVQQYWPLISTTNTHACAEARQHCLFTPPHHHHPTPLGQVSASWSPSPHTRLEQLISALGQWSKGLWFETRIGQWPYFTPQ
jgi:hypothetical protein